VRLLGAHEVSILGQVRWSLIQSESATVAFHLARETQRCQKGPIALLGTNLAVFVEQVQSESPHDDELAYHNYGRPLPPEARPFQPPNKPGYSYLRGTQAEVSSATIKLKFDMDGGKPVCWALAGGEPTTIIIGTGVGKHTEGGVPPPAPVVLSLGIYSENGF
jgi:hypothetical protein